MTSRSSVKPVNPWNALWAMMVGFFMILVDSTIVAVANPSIMDKLNADYDAVIWVTSAYLLAYAVPLLIAGRLGDRFGPKNLYLVGLMIFTLSSLWCGLSGSIETLIFARVVQGIGAALLTPQTLTTITRTFPAERRGAALSVWGATAGVATLVGPLAGGVLVDGLGWQWIFFVNVPVGVIGLALAVWLVPVLRTHKHRFDLLGVLLSGLAMFLIVFGLQEGQSHHWSALIWGTITGGVVSMGAFIYWQSVNTNEPLVPLRIFRDRDFSLSNVGIAVIGFVVTAMVLPVVFYAQAVCGLSPTRSALLLAPMAIATGVLAPVVGRIVDRSHPRTVIGCGFSTLAIALTWLSIEMTPTTPIWRLVLPLAAMGVGMAFIWAPLGATATRNLPAQLAGAGSGVYNATRQVGSVLGSAGMAAFLTSRLSAELPAALVGAPRSSEGSVRDLPDFLHEPFSAAMSQSMLLPAFVALFGVVAALFLPGFGGGRSSTAALPGTPGASRPVGTRDRGLDDPTGDRTDVFPVIGDFTEDDDPAYRRREYASAGARGRYGSAGYRSSGYHASGYDEGYDERYVDDEDDYVEYTVSFQERALGPPESDEPDVEPVDESDTTPLAARVGHPLHAPAETWHSEPVESWRSLLEESRPNPAPDPIGFAHNGFHVDDGQPLRPLGRPVPPAREGLPRRAGVNGSDALDADFTAIWEAANSANGSSSRHQMPEPEPHARHHRAEAEDPATYGRHSMPHRD